MSAAVSMFAEVSTGGRRARRVVVVGEMVGESQVVERIGTSDRPDGATIWSVRCACGSIQLRSAGDINAALRRGGSISCPSCLAEYRRGNARYRLDQRAEARLDRVRAGGPIWTAWETAQLQAGILADLEAEFGPANETMPSIADLQPAVGWRDGNVPTAEEVKARRERAEERAAYAKALGAIDRAVRSADRSEIDRLRRHAKEMLARMDDADVRAAQEEIAGERWCRVMVGEDIVRPDHVTKKSARARIRGQKTKSVTRAP